MSKKGYAATPIAAICREADLPVTALRRHFGSKKGLLVAVIERGTARWLATLPPLDGMASARAHRADATAEADHSMFLRLFYMLAVSRTDDAELVVWVRSRVVDHFLEAITNWTADAIDPEIAAEAAAELARFALATFDGSFFASQCDVDGIRLQRIWSDLATAIPTLAPLVIDRVRKARLKTGAEQLRNDTEPANVTDSATRSNPFSLQ